MMKDKTIIFGAGYLGNRIANEFQCRLVPRAEVDVTDERKLNEFLKAERPDVVINTVGKTGHPGTLGIDGCKMHESETRASNIDAACNLSRLCAENDIYFAHIGSGCIYSGNNQGRGFTEEDAPNFVGRQFYADTKIESEIYLKTNPGLLLRIRMPIDDRPHPRNLIDKLKGYTKLIDVQNSMTIVPEMIPALGKMIQQRANGVYNFVNQETISAAEIMTLYREIVDKNHQFQVIPVQELNTIVAQERSNCVLNTNKLKNLGIYLSPIYTGVVDCLKRYKSKQNG